MGHFQQNMRARQTRPARHTGIVDWTPERLRELAQELRRSTNAEAAEALRKRWKVPLTVGIISWKLHQFGGRAQFLEKFP
jgi:hypothetical protein